MTDSPQQSSPTTGPDTEPTTEPTPGPTPGPTAGPTTGPTTGPTAPSGGATPPGPPPGPAPQWQQQWQQQPGQQPWQQQPVKRLLRSRDDRWLAGVCAGIGEYAGLDPNLVRLLTVVAAVFSAGTLVIAYLIAWVLMPEA